jgi:thiol-disulfide isomerase/thioredoxin
MINTKKIVIGKVYANWCGHCISLKPEWKKMKTHIQNNYRGIDFIEAESSQTNKLNMLQHKYNITASGYPTLFKIKEGKVELYNGYRDANSLIEWASEPKHRIKRKSAKLKKHIPYRARHYRTRNKR